MARGYKQRFNINPNTGQATGTADEMALGGRDDVRQAEMKAAEDLANQVTSAQEALEEFEQTVRRAGTEGGFRDEVVQAIVDDFRQRLGVNASGSPGGTDEFDQRYAAGQIGDKLTAIAEEFQRGERSAEEASARMERVLDIFGEMAQLTDEEYAAVRNQFREAVGNPAGGGGTGGGGGMDAGGGSPAGGGGGNEIIQQLIGRFGGRFGLTPDVVKMLGGAGGGGAGGLGGILSGLGGGAGGGGGGIMGAAGSIAGPLALVTAGAKILEGFYKSVQETTKQMTAVATSIAGNDGIGSVTGAIEGASRQVTSKIPILGDAIQAQVEMYTGFLKAFDQVTEAFKRRGEELRRFDSNIAGASANAQVTKLLGDMNEAQKLGNEYAAIIREKAELQAEFQQALIPIKAAIMQTMIPILRAANDQLKLYNEIAERIGRDVKMGAEAVVALAQLSPAGAAIVEISKNVKKMQEANERKKMEKEQEMMKNLFDLDSLADMMDDRDMKQQEQKPLGIDLFRP